MGAVEGYRARQRNGVPLIFAWIAASRRTCWLHHRKGLDAQATQADLDYTALD